MDDVFGEFENLKISALSKSKSINNFVHNVTLGPNSCTLEHLTNNTPEIKRREKKKVKFVIKSPISNNERTSLGKILTEIEAQVKDEITTSIRSRLEKIQDASKQLEDRVKSNWVNKQKILIAQAQEQEDFMLKVLEEHDRKACDHLHQLKIQQQKQAEERSKRNLELQKKEKQRRELVQVFESIYKQQFAFRVLYQEIVTLLKENNLQHMRNNTEIMKDPNKFSIMSTISSKLKSSLESMEKLKETCKAQTTELSTKNLTSEQISQFITIGKANLEIAVSIAFDTAKLKETLQIILVSFKEEEDKRNVHTEESPVAEQVQEPKMTPPVTSAVDMLDSSNQMLVPASSTPVPPKLELPKENVASISNTVPPVTAIEAFVSKNALKEYTNLQNFLINYKKSFEGLVVDPRLKQYRFHCQKAVNIPLNAISAVNSQHLLDKYNRLSNLLRGNSVEAGGTNVASSQHPQGIAFCTDLLARKFVLQGDLLISSNPESAHCYAAVLVALWHDFPDFGKLVLAYFYQTMPYLVPFYPPKISGQTDQDYYISLGYNYIDGVVEKQDKFLKRMSGTMRLYAAVTISKLKRGQQGPHPHGLIYAWKWIANVFNMEPRSDITAALLFEFLEVTGSSMQAVYRNQFQKLLNYINNVYLEKMQQIDSGGPVTRLEVFLQKIKKNLQIEPPKGRLSENFW